MAYDAEGNYYFDPETDVPPMANEEVDYTDNIIEPPIDDGDTGTTPIGGTTNPDGSSGLYYDSEGNLRNPDGTIVPGSNYGHYQDSNGNTVNDPTAPPGAVSKNSLGQFLDAAGNVLKPLALLAAGSGLQNLASGGALGASTDLLKSALGYLNDVKLPDLLQMVPLLQQEVQQGRMDPATYDAYMASVQGKLDPAHMALAQQEDSNMAGLTADARYVSGANQALSGLANIAENRGLTDADRAQFAALMNQNNANAAQQRAGQIQQLQMQNQAGGGAELAARLAGTQTAANSNASAGADLAKSAQLRALTALQQGLTGNQLMNTTSFNQEAEKAKAQDAINQFNAQAKAAVNLNNSTFQQAANVGNFNAANQVAANNQAAKNAANQLNTQNTQAAGLSNFGMANQIMKDNNAIVNENLLMPQKAVQDNFTNWNTLANEKAGTAVNAGTALGNIANKVAANSSNIAGSAPATSSGSGNTLGQLASTAGSLKTLWDIGSSFFSDETLKTDKKQLSDDEVDEMMAKMSGYKYRYKGDKSNPEVHGVLAQDVEKGMPDSVINTPAGKMVQKPEMLNNVLAILANQHDRILRQEGKK